MALRTVDHVLGNIADPDWAGRLTGATLDILALDQWAAQRSRLRITTQAGTELAISLDRAVHLRDGDILAWDGAGATAVVVRIDLKPVMVVHLDGLASVDPGAAMRTCVELGHAIGNQHWPAVVKGDRVYVPLTVDRTVMASVMRTHAFEGIRTEFVPAAEVIPYLAPHESRRLFGAAEDPAITMTPTTDPTPAASLDTIARTMRLLQFGDSLLPVGAFSFSAALESAVDRGVVRDAATLMGYVATATRQAASADGIALLCAHRAAVAGDLDGVVRADRAVVLRKLDEEARTMSLRMGRKLAELGARATGGRLAARWLDAIREGHAPGTSPVGIGLLLAELGTPETDAFAIHQYGVASMILGAALRLMRIDHLETQSILFRVNQGAAAAYRAVADADLEDMSSFAPTFEILATVHAHAHVRLFMS